MDCEGISTKENLELRWQELEQNQIKNLFNIFAALFSSIQLIDTDKHRFMVVQLLGNY
jgi:hypothetical protein